ncbi:hypothetical protein OJAV_G00169190 [Oryzias javanicus]|uniref:MADF domain-containing protein n=1 Tax=Oryzias javanicus TaxID=123683 RepID=A0A3S2MKP6_ORYJA|nr:hypothetical protein OJAV_G00169190 [Oryzias javanicus]
MNTCGGQHYTLQCPGWLKILEEEDFPLPAAPLLCSHNGCSWQCLKLRFVIKIYYFPETFCRSNQQPDWSKHSAAPRSLLFHLLLKIGRSPCDWNSVSEEVGLPPDQCRKRWKSLRDRYMRDKRKELEQRNRSEGGPCKRWKYSAVPSFLDPFFSPREMSGNMDASLEDRTMEYDPEAETAAASSAITDFSEPGSPFSEQESLLGPATASSSPSSARAPSSSPGPFAAAGHFSSPGPSTAAGQSAFHCCWIHTIKKKEKKVPGGASEPRQRDPSSSAGRATGSPSSTSYVRY